MIIAEGDGVPEMEAEGPSCRILLPRVTLPLLNVRMPLTVELPPIVDPRGVVHGKV